MISHVNKHDLCYVTKSYTYKYSIVPKSGDVCILQKNVQEINSFACGLHSDLFGVI